jgi:imidazolonepropionase-like amidohydrolase
MLSVWRCSSTRDSLPSRTDVVGRCVQLFAVVLLPATLCAQAAVERPLAISGATIIDVRTGQLYADAVVLVQDGRIASIGTTRDLPIPVDAELVEAHGKFIMPGLINTHVHLEFPWHWNPPDTLASLGRLIAGGTTTVRDAGPGELLINLIELRQASAEGRILSPRIYLSEVVNSRTLARLDETEILPAVQRLRTEGVDFIKVMHGTRDETTEIIQAARLVGMPVYGHTSKLVPAPQEHFALAAVQAGISGIVHVHWIDFPDREEGPLFDQLKSIARADRFESAIVSRWLRADSVVTQLLIDSMVARGVWLEPTLAVLMHGYAAFNSVCNDNDVSGAIDRYYPSFGQTDPPLLTEQEQAMVRSACIQMQSFVRRFHEAGGKLITGTDKPVVPEFGVAEEMRLLVESGIPPLAALQAATINAAEALYVDEELGTIEVGKRADLLLLDHNPLESIRNMEAIHAVVLNGRFLPRFELRTLLKPVGASHLTQE